MGLLTFSINVTLDGCVDHQEGIADDETHAFFTRLMDEGGAMLWGRVTYEMLESYWPAVARGDEEAPPALRVVARGDEFPHHLRDGHTGDCRCGCDGRAVRGLPGPLPGRVAVRRRRSLPRRPDVLRGELLRLLQRIALVEAARLPSALRPALRPAPRPGPRPASGYRKASNANAV